MKPTKPLSRDRDQSPRTEVNRRRLIQLLKRYRRILKRQLAFLDSRATETVPLLLVRTAAKDAAGAEEASAAPKSARRQPVTLSVKNQDPGEFESNCASYAGPTATDAELVSTLTPYVSALTEQTGTTD